MQSEKLRPSAIKKWTTQGYLRRFNYKTKPNGAFIIKSDNQQLIKGIIYHKHVNLTLKKRLTYPLSYFRHTSVVFSFSTRCQIQLTSWRENGLFIHTELINNSLNTLHNVQFNLGKMFTILSSLKHMFN